MIRKSKTEKTKQGEKNINVTNKETINQRGQIATHN